MTLRGREQEGLGDSAKCVSESKQPDALLCYRYHTNKLTCSFYNLSFQVFTPCTGDGAASNYIAIKIQWWLANRG